MNVCRSSGKFVVLLYVGFVFENRWKKGIANASILNMIYCVSHNTLYPRISLCLSIDVYSRNLTNIKVT